MIVITGAAGFIGSCLVGKLNDERFFDLILVDDFGTDERSRNLEGKQFTARVERKEFPAWLDENHRLVQFIFHIGARTDTTEFDRAVFDELNLGYSKTVWEKCVAYGLPLLYASSAATYGDGSQGYSDSHDVVSSLKPLNPYGESKNDFDKWALGNPDKPYFWAGLKFFNVYGPNEYHKGRMASVVFHAYRQVLDTGKVRLFRSHRPDYRDGFQLRDFVYVKDIVDMCCFFLHHRRDSGLYNAGTGKARAFHDLAAAVFRALGREPAIEYIDMPEDIRDRYQYFTEADMAKLVSIGYEQPFHSLEDGVADYVTNYLSRNAWY